MTIKSTPLNGQVILTREDAEAFEKQIRQPVSPAQRKFLDRLKSFPHLDAKGVVDLGSRTIIESKFG